MLGFSLNWVMAHLIGDYILQNDWMAINKKKNSIICFIHVFLYMVPFVFTSLTLVQILLIGIQHFIQDRTAVIKWFCKITGKFQSENNNNGLPWGHFIVDNIFHAIWIMLVIEFIH